MIAPPIGSIATLDMPDRFLIMMFIGIVRSRVISIPIIPAINPSINVSALNTRDISFLLAPIARNIPISLVLSRTEM